MTFRQKFATFVLARLGSRRRIRCHRRRQRRSVDSSRRRCRPASPPTAASLSTTAGCGRSGARSRTPSFAVRFENTAYAVAASARRRRRPDAPGMAARRSTPPGRSAVGADPGRCAVPPQRQQGRRRLRLLGAHGVRLGVRRASTWLATAQPRSSATPRADARDRPGRRSRVVPGSRHDVARRRQPHRAAPYSRAHPVEVGTSLATRRARRPRPRSPSPQIG